MSSILIDNDIGLLTFELLFGQPLLHLTIKSKWTKDVRRECYELLEDIKIYLKEQGFNSLFVGAPYDDKKLQKFLTMFQFTQIAEQHDKFLYAQGL